MIKNKVYLIFIILFSVFISSIIISCSKPLKESNATVDEGIGPLYVNGTYSNIPNYVNVNIAETIGRNAFYKIQDAIDNAFPGTTIYIYPGIYNEILTVSKSLTIIGVNDTGAVIKGSLNIIDKSAKVSIFNIKLTNGPFVSDSRGIYNTGNLNINNCLIAGNRYSEKGAGIFNDNGVLDINDSTISSNINNSGVGGIFNLNGILTASYSKIYGNISGENNVDFYSNVEISASLNWWGDPTGPYNPTLNKNGKGNSISNNINFAPWYVDETLYWASSS